MDYMHTGGVRRVEVDKIRLHLDAGQIVLMTALGYSASGEVFNVRTDEVAAWRMGPSSGRRSDSRSFCLASCRHATALPR